jgi:DNA-binding transcriptional MerR regulator
MNQFSIRDIENLTGIRAHTLRIWEQRYRFDFSKRKDGGHRYYDGDDLKKILRFAQLYKKGHRISTLLELNEEQIIACSGPDLYTGMHSEAFRQLLEAVNGFDSETFNQVFELQVLRFGVQKTILEIIFPLLSLIGKKWLYNRAVPAQEHFCSELVMKKLIRAIDALEKQAGEDSRTVLLFTPSGESHEISLLFMHYLLKLNGSSCIYYGKNAALTDLKAVCEVHRPSHLYFHLITHLDTNPLSFFLEELMRSFPDQNILGAGPGLENNLLPGSEAITWLKNEKEMLQFATGCLG